MSSALTLPLNTHHKMKRLRDYHAYRRTLVGYAIKVWASLNRRTINGSCPRWDNRHVRPYLEAGIELQMTRDELMASIRADWDTIQAIWNAGGTPSIDRIDGNGPYSPDNIQFISLRDNCVKAAHETNVKRRIKKLVGQLAY